MMQEEPKKVRLAAHQYRELVNDLRKLMFEIYDAASLRGEDPDYGRVRTQITLVVSNYIDLEE